MTQVFRGFGVMATAHWQQRTIGPSVMVVSLVILAVEHGTPKGAAGRLLWLWIATWTGRVASRHEWSVHLEPSIFVFYCLFSGFSPRVLCYSLSAGRWQFLRTMDRRGIQGEVDVQGAWPRHRRVLLGASAWWRMRDVAAHLCADRTHPPRRHRTCMPHPQRPRDTCVAPSRYDCIHTDA